MNRTTLIMLASLLGLAAMVVMLFQTDRPQRREDGNGEPSAITEPLVLFCAASNRAVMEAIRADYETEFGRSVQIQYGPSQALLSSIEVSGSGDLFLPADDSFLKIAAEKKLIAEQIPIARMRAVIAVRKGNPKAIATLADLLKSDVRLVQASPDAAAIGKVTRETLRSAGLWESLDKATIAYRTTVTDVANDLIVGAADAGIVYDAVLHSYPDLEAIRVPELESAVSQVSIAVIAASKQPMEALHFARYLADKDKGLKQYAEHGFQVADGDEWRDVPELSLFAGSMLRPAIDDTIAAFEQREGVRVSRVYNGCGMLVNQLRTGSLDAAVAYLSNAAGSVEHLDAVQIQDIKCSVATQPFAISPTTRYPHLAARLFDALRSSESQSAFEAEGFRWKP